MSVPLDQPITSTFLVYSDPARTTLADATTVVVDVTDPTGAVTTYSLAGGGVTRASLGTYTLAYTPAIAGHYALHWRSGGTVATSQDDSFDVRDKYEPGPVALADVRAMLNITDTSQDDEIRGYMDAAAAMIANVVGPVTRTTYTEVHDGGGTKIALRRLPVISITSITEYVGLTGYPLTSQPLGSTTDNYGYSLDDPLTGIVTRRSSAGMLTPYLGGRGAVTVTYVAGRTSVPANIRLAALELIREMWSSTQRGNSSGRPVPGGDEATNQPVYVSADLPPMVRRLLMSEQTPQALA